MEGNSFFVSGLKFQVLLCVKLGAFFLATDDTDLNGLTLIYSHFLSFRRKEKSSQEARQRLAFVTELLTKISPYVEITRL